MTSTFVNNLALNEMATGDQSGSWGTVTNLNLELIGEGLGFATEAPFNTDANKTTTVAPGASDPARAMYFKVTSTVSGGLTATRQLTIDPDTINRLMFIENATTGGESITIKQGSGSGAAVTIPNGDTKAVILSGSGSGSIVLDAFASLSVVDLKVQDDLTVTDDAAIGGLATVGGTLGVTGVVTANAGVVVDNFTLDGTTLALSSGDFTVDVAGDIILDADGGEIRFKDAGAEIGVISNNGTNLKIQSSVSDKDIQFFGNDDGTPITALGLDMSDVGSAYFSHDIQLVDNAEIRFGAGNDLRISSNGSGGFIINEQGSLSIQSNNDFKLERTSAGDDYIHCIAGGAVELHHNGNKKLETAADGISVTGDVLIAAGGTLDIFNSGNTAATLTALLGADNGGGNGRTNSTVKSTVVGVPHYTNSEEPVALFVAGSTASSNFIEIGGGAGIINAATTVSIRTAANQTTTGGTTRLTVENNGDVTVEDGDLVIGTAGHGIDFAAQTATSASGASTINEVLNHYEDGSWTPAITDNSGRAGTQSIQVGRYIRVGRVVHIQGRVSLNGLASMGGNIILIGLPFTSLNLSNCFSSLNIGQGANLNITAGFSVCGNFSTNSTAMEIQLYDSTAGSTAMTTGEFSADGDIIFSGSYIAN